jgi:hypothetical protein
VKNKRGYYLCSNLNWSRLLGYYLTL